MNWELSKQWEGRRSGGGCDVEGEDTLMAGWIDIPAVWVPNPPGPANPMACIHYTLTDKAKRTALYEVKLGKNDMGRIQRYRER